MDSDNNPSTSLEANACETLNVAESSSDSEQDTSDSLGNLNIQTAASKRSCSDGDLDSDEEQTAKWRCIRKDDGNSSADIDRDNDNNNCCSEYQTNFDIITNANSDIAQVSYDSPYTSHISSNHICAAEWETDGKSSHINCLPHMIMTRIFSYLPLSDLLRKVCLVCQYWRNVAYDPVLWRNIRLRSHPKVSDQTLLGLVQLSQNVSLLDVTDSKFLTSEGMLKVLKHCRFLTTLKVVRVQQLNAECLSAVGLYCPNIKKLYLDSCYALNDDALQKISKGCADHLEELRLNYCGNISDQGIISVSTHCQSLRYLMLSQCQQVTNSCMETLVIGCPNMETLMLMSCGLTDAGVSKLAQLQHLKVLDLSNIGALTPHSVKVIVKSCKLLESLNLSLCRSINDDCVNYIAKTAKNLKYLYMVSCTLTDKALQHIADHSKLIDTLDVGWCQAVTLEGVIKVSTSCEKTLQHLGLMRCDKILPPDMDEVVERFPTITYSTMHLDCKRLIEKARKGGHLPEAQKIGNC